MILSLLKGIDFHHADILTIEGAAAIVFYFTLYSFIGWLLENSYSYFTTHIFFKENFLFGPFKPIYGFAPILLVYLIVPKMNGTLIILFCFTIPTLVEYISGAMLQKLFQKQWWDYSDMPIQLHGHICLPFSICWGLLSFICLVWIHPVITLIYSSIELYWGWIWAAVGLYFLADLVLAIRKHTLKDTIIEETGA